MSGIPPASARQLLLLWVPVIVYMALIFYGSSLEDPPVPSNVPDVDLHAAAYFGLMLLVIRALAGGTWSKVTLITVIVAFAITVAYGASDEWHQRFVPGRHSELRDLRADAIGAFAAGVLAKAWGIIRRL